MIKAVREQIHAGADLLKLMATGGVMTPGVNPEDAHFTFEEISAGIQEAKRFHKRSASHAQGHGRHPERHPRWGRQHRAWHVHDRGMRRGDGQARHLSGADPGRRLEIAQRSGILQPTAGLCEGQGRAYPRQAGGEPEDVLRRRRQGRHGHRCRRALLHAWRECAGARIYDHRRDEPDRRPDRRYRKCRGFDGYRRRGPDQGRQRPPTS